MDTERSTTKLPRITEIKVRTWYRLHNKKRNGFMSRLDFVEMAQSFVNEYDLDESKAEEVRSWLVDGWSSMLEYLKDAESEGNTIVPMENIPTVLKVVEILSSEGTIDEDMYTKAFAEALQIQSSPFPDRFRQMVSLFFNIFDVDSDGLITDDELVRGLRCFGITNIKAVKALFSDLDTENTGTIDKQKYVDAWVEFMTGMDQEAAMAKNFTPAIL